MGKKYCWFAGKKYAIIADVLFITGIIIEVRMENHTQYAVVIAQQFYTGAIALWTYTGEDNKPSGRNEKLLQGGSMVLLFLADIISFLSIKYYKNMYAILAGLLCVLAFVLHGVFKYCRNKRCRSL